MEESSGEGSCPDDTRLQRLSEQIESLQRSSAAAAAQYITDEVAGLRRDLEPAVRAQLTLQLRDEVWEQLCASARHGRGRDNAPLFLPVMLRGYQWCIHTALTHLVTLSARSPY
eukprot:GHVU01216171.1.p1 GENE.GHVU01216171.1~~GHVU01216171.1.p1  ORF type:complete len:114 (+),score=8.56 GHVU01216171.1:376-717(+)